jgi:hypothetical protein
MYFWHLFLNFKKIDVIYITMLNFILNNCQKEKVGMYSNLSKRIKYGSFYIVKTMITNVLKVFLGFFYSLNQFLNF